MANILKTIIENDKGTSVQKDVLIRFFNYVYFKWAVDVRRRAKSKTGLNLKNANKGEFTDSHYYKEAFAVVREGKTCPRACFPL